MFIPKMVVPLLRRLAACLSLWRPMLDTRGILVGVVVDKVLMGKDILQLLKISRAIIILQRLHTHSFIHHLH